LGLFPYPTAAPKAVSVADSHPANDDLTVTIDATPRNDAAIVIVVEDYRASKTTPLLRKTVAAWLVRARSAIVRPTYPEFELDLRLRGRAEGSGSRNGSGNQERT